MRSKAVIAIICLMSVWIIADAFTNAQTRRKQTPAKPTPNTKPNATSPSPKSGNAAKPANEEISDALLGKFSTIPAGEFVMGANNDEFVGERPIHKVIISRSFEMGQTEVTQTQWKAVMGNNPSDHKGPNLPVESVSWIDIQNFLQLLNSKVTNYTYRLPTEAEWEYACRAGTTGDYSGNLESMAWFANNSGVRKIDSDKIFQDDRIAYVGSISANGCKPRPVGQKQPNAWGLHDMHGNVWEWCQDWYGDYSSADAVDPQGPSSGTDRVIRGGSWYDRPENCRSASRNANVPNFRFYDLGFRLVRTPR